MYSSLLLAALLLQQPAAVAAPAIDVAYTQFTLPNGLHVILH